MPSIGDTIRYTNVISSNLSFTTKGTNFNWNFSTLGINSQGVYEYKSLINTPYAQQIVSGLPFGAIGYKVADSIGGGGFSFKDIYNFYQKASGGWSAVGTGLTIPVGATTLKTGGVYSDKDEIYTFPLNYNDSDFTSFKVTTPLGISFLNVGSFMQKGTRSNKVEGWGTITTPYASNVQCLKIKSIVQEIDSLKLAIPSQTPVTVGIPNNRVEYRWLSTTEKIPMLEVVGTEIGGNFTPTQIRYRDNYRVPKPSPFGPRPNFTVDKNVGLDKKDTFKFTNLTTPSVGSTYEWTVTPSAGVQYVNSTNVTSTNPQLVFNNVGVYSIKLKATNIAGFRDTTIQNLITINNNPSTINDVSTNEQLFYPNPVQNQLSFYNKQLENAQYFIFDMNGKLFENGIISKSLNLPLEQLESGNYILLIKHQTQYIYNTFQKL